jgi:hypothetical protein
VVFINIFKNILINLKIMNIKNILYCYLVSMIYGINAIKNIISNYRNIKYLFILGSILLEKKNYSQIIQLKLILPTFKLRR